MFSRVFIKSAKPVIEVYLQGFARLSINAELLFFLRGSISFETMKKRSRQGRFTGIRVSGAMIFERSRFHEDSFDTVNYLDRKLIIRPCAFNREIDISLYSATCFHLYSFFSFYRLFHFFHSVSVRLPDRWGLAVADQWRFN